VLALALVLLARWVFVKFEVEPSRNLLWLSLIVVFVSAALVIPA